MCFFLQRRCWFKWLLGWCWALSIHELDAGVARDGVLDEPIDLLLQLLLQGVEISTLFPMP